MRVVPRVVHAREAWPSGEVLRSRLPPARVRKTEGLERIAQLEQELELERQFNHAARDER